MHQEVTVLTPVSQSLLEVKTGEEGGGEGTGGESHGSNATEELRQTSTPHFQACQPANCTCPLYLSLGSSSPAGHPPRRVLLLIAAFPPFWCLLGRLPRYWGQRSAANRVYNVLLRHRLFRANPPCYWRRLLRHRLASAQVCVIFDWSTSLFRGRIVSFFTSPLSSFDLISRHAISKSLRWPVQRGVSGSIK